MPRSAILLRGVNLGATNRISMPALRAALAESGFTDVATYLQSGNIAVAHVSSPSDLTAEIESLISERFGLSVPAMVRTHDELAAVVAHNPFPDASANDPKRYEVTFLSGDPDIESFAEIAQLATPEERVTARGREIYAWHPAAIHNSKLANRLTPKKLGVESATARNWTTVMALHELTS